MRFNDLSGWLGWQARLSPKAVDLGLERVDAVWQRLGRPDLQAPVLTVAGTNGKGSSVAFAEAILRAGGYRVGCYTSPHLQRYNERIQVDGEAVSDEAICAAFARIDDARGDVPLTYFEFGTLAALCIFADARLDAVVLEVGLGGRLDAVNLIDPDVALISSIGLDHQEWLGDDLEQIGGEKAGIMRQGRPVVYSGRGMPNSVRAHAEQLGARLSVAGSDYRVERQADSWDLRGTAIQRLALPYPTMRGGMQVDNAAGVLVALGFLAGGLAIDQRAVRGGLLSARAPGRFEVRPGRPNWVLDVAHNPQAAGVLNAMLGDYFVPGRRIAVFGMLADKDAAGVAAELATRFDAWYLIDLAGLPRGQSAEALAERIRPVLGSAPLHTLGAIDSTLAAVSENAAKDDLVVVFGSFLTVGAAMTWMEQTAAARDG